MSLGPARTRAGKRNTVAGKQDPAHGMPNTTVE